MATSPGRVHSASFHDLFRPEAISDQTHAVNERLVATLASLTPPADFAAAREPYSQGALGLPSFPRSQHARTLEIAGPAGPVNLRILAPENPRGVYLHIHGGGFTVGSNDTWDGLLEMFGREAGMASVSVEYRLAPEDPFPAGVDDCVAAALWLIDHAQAEFGVSWLAIGGESAGANLAVSTLVRLRDMGRGGAFAAVNLLFGWFDLSMTPSARASSGTPFVDHANIPIYAAAYSPAIDVRDPAVSALYADLSDLPPAFVTVGTIDPLLDDSLFMHARWQAAGNPSELALYPGGNHGFNALDGDLARDANDGMAQFLDRSCRSA
jgi:acetyl esterase/lipase